MFRIYFYTSRGIYMFDESTNLCIATYSLRKFPFLSCIISNNDSFTIHFSVLNLRRDIHVPHILATFTHLYRSRSIMTVPRNLLFFLLNSEVFIKFFECNGGGINVIFFVDFFKYIFRVKKPWLRA